MSSVCLASVCLSVVHMKLDQNRPVVLLVNNDLKILEVFTVMLKREGYRVVTAASGGEALELAVAVEPAIVISDVAMPSMDGLELCRRLKQDAHTADVPVLLVSAVHKAKADSLRGLVAGADDYLEMPFRRKELLVKVARLTERYRVERHYREIVEQAVDIIYTHDMQGRITSINEAGARFFNRPAAELVGTHFGDLVGAEAAARDSAEIAKHSSREPLRLVHCLRDASGERHYLEDIITLVCDPDGQPTGMRGVMRDITQLVQTTEALRESEERYRALIEQSSDGIYLADAETKRVLEANLSYLRLLGYTAQEIQALTLYDLTTTDQAIVDEYIQRILTDGHHFVGERQHRRKDGSLVDVEISADRIAYGGKVVLCAMVRDIAERKRAEEALRESEKRYRELFENANDIIYTHDLAGNFTSLNRTGERITGYTRDEAIQMNIANIVAPEHLAYARQMIARKTISEISTIYELEIIAKSGQRVPLEVSTRLIYRDGKPAGIQGIARDITERKRDEAELRRQALVFETIYDGVLLMDLDFRIVDWNPAAERIYGYSKAEMLGQSPERFHHPALQGALEREIRDTVLRTGRWAGELPFMRKDGVAGVADVIVMLQYDAKGHPMSVIGVNRDITESKRVENALAQQAEREALINRISSHVRRSLDVAQVFHTAVHELGLHLNVDRCSLFMLHGSEGLVHTVAEYHTPGVRPVNRNFNISAVADLIEGLRQDGVLTFDDAAHDERIREVYNRILRPVGTRSIMYVGIKAGEEMVGAFALSTVRSTRQWHEADIALAKAVADQTGIAIRQAELYQKAAATSAREALINRLSLAIRASLSMREVLSTATRELGSALAASRVHLCLYDPTRPHSSQAEYEYVAQNTPSLQRVDISYDDPIGQRLLRSAEPIVIDNTLNCASGSAQFNAHVRAQAALMGVRSQINCPLIVNGRFRGALCIHQTDRVRHWTEDEVALVEAVAAQLTIGIAQAELFEMVTRAKKEWETTFDAMSDGIFIFDRSGQLIRVNLAGAAMEDTWPHLLLGRRCCDILRPRGAATCFIEKGIAEGRSITVEITPERSNRQLLVTLEPIFATEGGTVGAVCTARDLSELRKVEAIARERQSLLTNILESVSDPICALDSRGHYLWLNTASIELSGYQPEDLIGHSFLETLHPADREMAQENFASALRGEPRSYEVRYITRDNEVRDALFYNAPLVMDGRTTSVLSIGRDITELKQQRQRAAQADKLRALGQLASGVAHDFNNALAAILGRAQLMRRQVNTEELLHNLDIIQTAAEDAASTVRRIQTFARQSEVEEFVLLDASSLLRDAVEITRTRWENEARARGLEYQVEVNAAPSLYTRGNASELREVFVNLIVNAIDAMPRGGRLSISCERVADQLVLRFADTGTGMTEDVREKIFEPFYTTKGAHGTGLGLAVSYGIIERHGGSISVESEVGVGTIFEIRLTAAEPAQVSGGEQQVEPATSSLSVLVVDDEPFVRETLAEMLTAMSHKTVTANDGQTALEQLATGHFDLVFTDLSMPDMDGWELAREIRRRFGAEIGIVLVTGYGKGMAAPAEEKDLINGVIGKPFDFAQVAETIKAVTSKRMNAEV